MRVKLIGFIFLIALLGMLTSRPAWSQGTVSLSGSVMDRTGAVIPGVDITLTNLATSATRAGATNEQGRYVFAQLPPGTYKLEFKKDGFTTAIRDNVALPIGTNQVISVSLEIGAVVETVVVEGGALPVNTIDASVGNPFTELQVKQLPLEARNPSQLLSLQAGVVWAGERLSDERTGSVFGGRGNQGNITLDGADVNDQVNQSAMQSVLPIPLDSVQEFRVTTTAAGAQYGRSGGAQIELVTKGGSNEWHGSAYEFNRNDVFSTNGFFENRLGLPRAPLKRNIFGASGGGAIKKNRAFIFANWESRRDATATPQTRVVPTNSFKDGVLLYQCNTASACPGGTVTGLTATHTVPAGWFGLTPNQIAQVIDPCGSTICTDILGRRITPGVNSNIMSLLKAYPTGNDPGLGASLGLDNGFNASGYRFAAPIKLNNNDYVARFDLNVDRNGKHTVFWRGSLADDKRIDIPQQFLIDPLTGQPGDPTSTQLNNSKGMAVSYTFVPRPTLINTVRYGFTRQGLETGGTQGTTYTTRGFTQFRNFTRGSARKVPTHSIQDDITWNKGKHNVQFGFATRHITNNRTSFSRSFESFSTNNGWASGLGRNCVLPGASAGTCPNAAAINALPRIAGGFQTPYARLTEDILGIITQAGATTFQFDLKGAAIPFGTPQFRQFVTTEYEGYVQDSLRLTSNLTVTAGIRYSFATVPYEKQGRQVIPDVEIGQWFAQRLANMEQGIPSDASPLITFKPGGKVNNAPGWFANDKNNFAPRASFAYSPGFTSGLGHLLFGGPAKSSIRGGFSLVYDRLSGGLMGELANQGEVGLASSVTSPQALLDYLGNPSTGTRTAPRFTGYTSFPPTSAFFTPPKGGFPALVESNSNNSGAAIIGNLHTPYSLQYSFSIQREFAKGTVLDVGYVGRFGRSLLLQGDYAQWLRFRDPVSKMNVWEAFNELEKVMNSSTLAYDGSCLRNLNSCPVIPFIENVFSGMAAFRTRATGRAYPSNTAAMAEFAAATNAPGWADLIRDLDVNIPINSGTSVYNSTIDPQRNGRVLFPQQYAVFSTWTNNAQSFYNGLVVSLRRRMGRVQFDANYVLSKSLDDGSALEGESSFYSGVTPDNFTPRAQRAFSDFDLRHNFNSNWLYELPIGRGRSLGSNFPGWADQIVGGWQITGVSRWRAGFPVGVANGFWFPTTWDVAGNATRIAPVETKIRKSAEGGPNLFSNPVDSKASNPFNASGTAYAAYVHTPMGGSGTRNNLRAGRFFTIDLGIAKTFRMPVESHRLQFRWEIFNVMNSVSFASARGSDISLNLDSVSSFGRIINAASSASQSYPLVPHNRVMQLGLRYEF